MTAGIARLLRLLAAAGMLMAFGQFLLLTAHWVQFDSSANGPWVGKRVKDRVAPPQFAATKVSPKDATYQCQAALREELMTWLHYVQPSGQWLALCGILYLLAGRRKDVVERSDLE